MDLELKLSSTVCNHDLNYENIHNKENITINTECGTNLKNEISSEDQTTSLAVKTELEANLKNEISNESRTTNSAVKTESEARLKNEINSEDQTTNFAVKTESEANLKNEISIEDQTSNLAVKTESEANLKNEISNESRTSNSVVKTESDASWSNKVSSEDQTSNIAVQTDHDTSWEKISYEDQTTDFGIKMEFEGNSKENKTDKSIARTQKCKKRRRRLRSKNQQNQFSGLSLSPISFVPVVAYGFYLLFGTSLLIMCCMWGLADNQDQCQTKCETNWKNEISIKDQTTHMAFETVCEVKWTNKISTCNVDFSANLPVKMTCQASWINKISNEVQTTNLVVRTESEARWKNERCSEELTTNMAVKMMHDTNWKSEIIREVQTTNLAVQTESENNLKNEMSNESRTTSLVVKIEPETNLKNKMNNESRTTSVVVKTEPETNLKNEMNNESRTTSLVVKTEPETNLKNEMNNESRTTSLVVKTESETRWKNEICNEDQITNMTVKTEHDTNCIREISSKDQTSNQAVETEFDVTNKGNEKAKESHRITKRKNSKIWRKEQKEDKYQPHQFYAYKSDIGSCLLFSLLTCVLKAATRKTGFYLLFGTLLLIMCCMWGLAANQDQCQIKSILKKKGNDALLECTANCNGSWRWDKLGSSPGTISLNGHLKTEENDTYSVEYEGTRTALSIKLTKEIVNQSYSCHKGFTPKIINPWELPVLPDNFMPFSIICSGVNQFLKVNISTEHLNPNASFLFELPMSNETYSLEVNTTQKGLWHRSVSQSEFKLNDTGTDITTVKLYYTYTVMNREECFSVRLQNPSCTGHNILEIWMIILIVWSIVCLVSLLIGIIWWKVKMQDGNPESDPKELKAMVKVEVDKPEDRHLQNGEGQNGKEC